MNNWLLGLVRGALAPVAALITPLVSPPRVSVLARLSGLWSGTRAIANALYVVVVMAAGVLLAGQQSVQTRHGVKEIAPRVVIGFLAANLSWPLITMSIELARALAEAVTLTGWDPGLVMSGLLRNSLAGGLVLLALLAVVATVMIVILLASLVFVLALLAGLIVAAPLALSCHALPVLEPIAWAWWKAFFACLAVPTAQALLIAVAGRVLLADPSPQGGGLLLLGIADPSRLLSLVLVLALLYLMIKIPWWLLRPALSVSGGRGGRRSAVGSLLRTVLAFKTLGALGIVPATAAGVRASANPGRAVAKGLLLGGGKPTPRPGTPATPGGPGGRGGPGRGGPGAGGAGAGGAGAGGAGDPYRGVRVGAGGQYLLPLGTLRRTHRAGRAARGATPAAGSPDPTSAGRVGRSRRGGQPRGRQLRLPGDGHWPEQRPMLGRDGQYRLPITLTRVPPATAAGSPPSPPAPGVASPGGANQPTRASRPARSTQPTPTQPAPSTRPAVGRRGESPRPVRARQLALPLRGGWPEDRPARPVLGRDGQYRLPITVTARPRRAQPPRTPRAPRVPLVPLPPEAAGQPAATPGTSPSRQRRLPVRTLAAPPAANTGTGSGGSGSGGSGGERG